MINLTEYCKNCGSELEEGAVFCNECGTKTGESSPLGNKYISANNPFKLYDIQMINGEKIIRQSEIHNGCFLAPGILVGVGVLWVMISVISSSVSYYSNPLVGFVFGLLNPFLIIGLIWLVIRYITFSNTDLILTNRRVFGKCGVISTVQMQSPLNKIDTVSYSNGLFGRLLGYGTVIISTTSSHFRFRYIRDGHTLYNDIFHQLEISENEMIEKQANAIAKAIKK